MHQLPKAAARDAAMDTDRVALIGKSLDREIAAGRIPGAVLAIARDGRQVHLAAHGVRDPASRAPMAVDTIFSIASMTKVMTSVAILMLHEEGRLLIGDPVSAYLPELAGLKVATRYDANVLEIGAPLRIPTIQDLLRHTSGFTYRENGSTLLHKKYPSSSVVGPFKHTKAETISLLADSPLLCDPGANWNYGFSTDVLGFVVEAITGQTLGQFLQERLWTPLAMVDTSFTLTPDKRARYAHALPVDPLSGQPQVQVMHTNPAPMKWDAGGGGCVSTAADYLKFAEMLRQGGTLGGVRILGPRTVAYMTSDHLSSHIEDRIADTMDPGAAAYGFGLGVAVRRQTGRSAMLGSAGDFYWSGVYGTYFWVDPEARMSVVFMAMAPGLMRLRYRQLVRGLVYQALTD
jgi:CubicO group peptidase (beta-lactamase class C family)